MRKNRLARLIVGSAVASICLASTTTAQANLLTNGDFTQGTYSSTADVQIGDSIISLTANVPNGWTATPGFSLFYNGTGPGYVAIGNNPPDPVAGISQGFGDTAGRLYQVTFDLQGEGAQIPTPSWYFNALLDGVIALNISPVGGLFNSEFTFSFTGTGFDTLSFLAANNDRSYLLSNVGVSAAPLPSGLPLFITGLAALGLLAWRNKRTAASRA